MLKIKVERLHEDVVIPEFAHATDSGFDLFTYDDKKIKPRETVIIPTGLKFEIPEGWGIQIKNKSGITVKGAPVYSKKENLDTNETFLIDEGKREYITVFEGTIDMNYRGEIGIMVRNDNDYEIIIPKHTKIAQGVLRQVYSCVFEEVESVDTNTDRGEGGYGSTGINIKKDK